MRKYLEACQELLRDIRLLSSDSGFDAYGYEAKARDNDAFAQDMVDLVLFQSMAWIQTFGAGTEAETYHAAKRVAHYERLHAKHDAAGAPRDIPFNRVSTESE